MNKSVGKYERKLYVAGLFLMLAAIILLDARWGTDESTKAALRAQVRRCEETRNSLPVACDVRPCDDMLAKCVAAGGDWLSSRADGTHSCYVNSSTIDLDDGEGKGL